MIKTQVIGVCVSEVSDANQLKPFPQFTNDNEHKGTISQQRKTWIGLL